MDRFFKKATNNEVAQAKEEIELLQQKVKTMGDVATTLEAQLNEEKTKYTQLVTKTTQWKEKVKVLTETDRFRIAQLESELSVFQAAQAANGGEITSEVQAAIRDALQTASTTSAAEAAQLKETVAALESTIAVKDTQIHELQQELESVKAVYLESQGRFADEMQSVTQHHEKEMEELRSQLVSLKEMDALKARLQEQKEEIASLENHSHQQSHIVLSLQQDLAAATGHNKELEQQLQNVRDALTTLEQKQAVWKEKVMQMKAKDNETIKHLEAELAQSREPSVAPSQPAPIATDAAAKQPSGESAAAGAGGTDSAENRSSLSQSQDQLQQLQIQLEEERLTHRQFEEKLESWKQKAKQIRLQDVQTIQELQMQCEQLQQQLATQQQSQSMTSTSAVPRDSDTVESPLDSRVSLQLANIQSELDAALQARDDMQKQLQHQLEEARELRQQLEAKESPEEEVEHTLRTQLRAKEEQLEQLEARLAAWKAKVKESKTADMEKIQDLQAQITELQSQTASGADAQDQAVQTLREQLEAAQQARDETAQQHAEEVQALRDQLTSGADAQDQAVQTLREQLEAAQQALAAKQVEFDTFEARVINWKEKVKSVKTADAERIKSLELEVEQLREQVSSSTNLQDELAGGLKMELETAQQREVELAAQHTEEVQRMRDELNDARQSLDQAAEQHEVELQSLREKLDAAEQAAAETAQQHAEETKTLQDKLVAETDAHERALQALHEQFAESQRAAEEAAQHHTEELQALRDQLAAGADTQSHAVLALQTELEAAQQQISELQQTAAETAAKADTAEDTAQTLRAEVEAAEEEGRRAQLKVHELTEEAAAMQQELATKTASLEKLEESLVVWKEKVKAAKVGDAERIQALEQKLQAVEADALAAYRSVAGFSGAAEAEQAAEALPDDWASTVNWYLIEVQTAINNLCEEVGLAVGKESAIAAVEALSAHTTHEKAALQDAIAAKEQSETDATALREEAAAAAARCTDAETRAAALEAQVAQLTAQDERVREVEAENTELKTRCDLLRKELQRQREAVHRERAQQQDGTGAESPASPTAESASAVQSVLRAAAGGITDRDVASFVGGHGAQDGSVRSSKSKLDQLMKLNEELKRENAHNNSVIAQYIRELEGYKSNERIQLSIEYLRNIVQQYLCAAEDLRPKMIPAICTVLEFTTKQKESVQAANPLCPKFH